MSAEPTKAVVLAAGVGSRLGAVTERVPKCMIDVGGRPVLEHNLRRLAADGIRDVAINLHHLPDQVTRHFGDGAAWGARITWLYEEELLGTAGTITALRDWIDGETFLVVYGDNVLRLNLFALLRAHRQRSALATVALFDREDVEASGVAELDASGRVVRFLEKPAAQMTESRLVNAGVLVFDRAALTGMPARGDLSHDVLPRLAEVGSLFGHRLSRNEAPLWIDTPLDLARAKALSAVNA
jgi:mannose-1-phosphate guanylyltransferase